MDLCSYCTNRSEISQCGRLFVLELCDKARGPLCGTRTETGSDGMDISSMVCYVEFSILFGIFGPLASKTLKGKLYFVFKVKVQGF